MESVDEIPAEVAEEAGKVANGNPPKDHPEIEHSLSKEEWEHYQAIKEANLEVSEAQMAYDIANGKAKEAKKHLESVSLEHVRGGKHRDYPDGLRSIPGVGEKTVDKWEDDVVNWLAKNAREPEGQMSPGIGETQ